jgi:hypothetical protein
MHPDLSLDACRLGWTSVASQLVGEYFDLAKPYIDKGYAGLNPHVRFVNAQLFIDCALTSESVLLLVRAGKEWDADLIARSVVEGSLKYVYMMSGTPSEMFRKATEYWNTLPAFASVRRSERARAILASVPNPDDIQWRPFRDLVISAADVDAARKKTNHCDRKDLERQWSFSGIVRHFVASGRPELMMFAQLAHGYANSSHLIHKDGDGVGMVWDRYRREPERHDAISLAHAARLVSDVCSFGNLRLLYLLRACSASRTGIDEIDGRYERLFVDLDRAHQLFNEVEYRVPCGGDRPS